MRKLRWRMRLFSWGLAVAFTMAFTSPCFGAIKVGVGETIITPPVGIALYGYSRANVSDGVHDDLHARSLVVEGENGITAVFMTLALEWVSRPIFDAIREGIQKETGIPATNIIICATHTHSGPELQPLDHPYTKTLIARSIESATTAWKNMVPGKIGFGSGVAREMGMNDRQMQYGGLHPDPEVGIIKIENLKGKLLGVAFNYGCHPSVLSKYNLKITEDWPYYSIKGLRDALGKNVWIAYYQSAQGDVKVGYSAELSAVGADMPIRTFEYAEYKGNMLVDAVRKVLPSIVMSSRLDVATAEKTFEFPARDGFRLSVEEAQKQADEARAAMEDAGEAHRCLRQTNDRRVQDAQLPRRAASRRRQDIQRPEPSQNHQDSPAGRADRGHGVHFLPLRSVRGNRAGGETAIPEENLRPRSRGMFRRISPHRQ